MLRIASKIRSLEYTQSQLKKQQNQTNGRRKAKLQKQRTKQTRREIGKHNKKIGPQTGTIVKTKTVIN